MTNLCGHDRETLRWALREFNGPVAQMALRWASAIDMPTCAVGINDTAKLAAIIAELLRERGVVDGAKQPTPRTMAPGVEPLEGTKMCQACAVQQFDLIPSAHNVSCVKRAPYMRFERMASTRLRDELPALVANESRLRDAWLATPSTEALNALHEAMRATRACSDALAKFRPSKTRPVGAARAARSWR